MLSYIVRRLGLMVVTLFGVSIAIFLLLQVFVPYRRYAPVLKFLTLTLFAYVATALTVNIPWSAALLAAIWPKPEPSSPTRLATGTRTSTKDSSAVSEQCHPIFRRPRSTVKPGVPFSTRKRRTASTRRWLSP